MILDPAYSFQFDLISLLTRVHPGYFKGISRSPDIALVHLTRTVKVIRNLIAPLCLPIPGEEIEDVPVTENDDVEAYVSGWGFK